ncbi:helix-turn-helix domain-containing protein [Cohnella sp.]|uniref:helix-turn-helix domain-containing protein n=1 Tax=Cohnella sp. TaxID=1883426 RepID=UPI003562AEA8
MKGETVRAIRVYHELSQNSMAAQLGLTAGYLCMIESNKRAVSDVVKLKIAQRYGVDDSLIEALRRSSLISKLTV